MRTSDANMESSPKWDVPLSGVMYLITFICLISGNSYQSVAEKIDDSEFIGIDCGVSEDYMDETTGLLYQTDKNFIETGINHDLVSFAFDNPFEELLLKTIRSFPEGDRNCYTLKPKQGKNNTYNIGALFSYQNYDYKNQVPIFDLYIGANYWVTVQLDNASDASYYDMIYQPLTDIIQVCLVNTGSGTPFISSLELQSLNGNNSIYSISNYSSLPLDDFARADIGATYPMTPSPSRYKDDPYHRRWYLLDWSTDDWFPLNTSDDTITEFGNSAYKLPSTVLKTAVQPANLSSSLALNRTYGSSEEFLVYLHFAEIQKLPKGHKRIINVSFGDLDAPAKVVTLEYLKPITLSSNKPTKRYAAFTIRAAAGSNAPPILNAFEVYKLLPQPHSLTDEADVDAILEIKRSYGISKINWQGDPCAPIPPRFPWDGLNCSFDKIPRIVSLNLSSCKLSGNIATAFSRLQKLEFLDLSYNELTGPLQGFLAELPNLKLLDVRGNKLTGSIPGALKEKAYLNLSLADNPDLCQKDSCKEHKFVNPLIASSIAVFLIIIIVSLLIWRLKRKRKGLLFQSQKGSLRPKNQAFSYLEILNVTNNFKTILGEGGFGKVYLGTLQDDTLIAVKFLSLSSRQGYKEFQSEAQLMMIVHHRNFVSLIGYCDEGDFKALVYEYMDNGDLRRKLSVKNSNILKWNSRLQIAVDVAKGLDYLHNGCKAPIIHRDLKPSNILLDSNMHAKISDFGLSRAFLSEKDSHLSTQPAGTPGYIDPQFQRSGVLNKQSDIYSFGMVLLELITGFPPVRRASDQEIIFILDWIHPKIESGDIQDIIDSRLQGEFCTHSVWKAVEIAMSCIVPTPAQRPDINYVLHDLMECLALEMDDLRIENYRSGSCNSLDFSLPSAR